MKRIVITLVLAMSVLPLFGQDNAADTVSRNNPYKIDDRLYPIYRRADKERATDLCLRICDTLRSESIRLSDPKAEVLSYVLPVFYWSRHFELDSLSVAADKLREVARRNDFLQYYYQAYSQQSVTYMNLGQFAQARKVIDAMRADAQKDQFPFGLYNCFIQNAHFYNLQGDIHRAIEEYVKAAEYMEENIPDQSPSAAYLQATLSCLWDSRFEDALKYSRKGLEYYSESKTNINLYNYQCVALFFLGRNAEFSESFKNYKAAVAQYGRNSQTVEDPAMAAYYAINGQYDQAVRTANSIRDGFLKHLLLKEIYEEAGDYRNAVTQADSVLMNARRAFARTVEFNTVETTTLLENERLSAENTKLDLEHQLARRRMQLVLFISIFLIACASALTIILRNRKHIQQLKQANAAKDIFVKNMSHEVRTPLNAVVGFSQLLAEPDLLSDEEREEFAMAVADNGNMLAMMIDDILSTSDMVEGSYVIELSDARLLDICKSAMKTSETRLPAGVTMSLELGVTPDFTIHTDARRVQQMLINLLNNACKNTVEGTITLYCGQSDDKVVLTVSDTGCGIPADKAEKVFERFYKIDQFKQGSGMGLAICRDIASRLGGSIRLDTTYSPGARFILELPR